MTDCRSALLVLPRHLSAHHHAALAACENDHRDGAHSGRLLEVDGPHVVDTIEVLHVWSDDDPRAFVRPTHGRHVLEPETCRGEVTWVPGARCCLPAGHDGKCRP